MTTIASRLLLAFCLAALFLIGVDWLLETSDLTFWLFGKHGAWQGMRSLPDGGWSLAIGVALVLLPVLAASAWVLVGRDSSIRARAKDGDLIRLRPEAVEHAVARAVRDKVEEVLRVRCEARQGRNQAPAVRVHVAVVDAVPVPELRTRVRAASVEVLKHLLGVADAEQVHVVVHDIQPPKGEVAPRQRPNRSGKRRERPRRPEPSKIAAEDES